MGILDAIKAQATSVYTCSKLTDPKTGDPLEIPIQKIHLESWINEELLPLGSIYPSSQQGDAQNPALVARLQALKALAETALTSMEQGEAKPEYKLLMNKLISRGAPSFRDPRFGCLLFCTQAEIDAAKEQNPEHPGGVLTDWLGDDYTGLINAILTLSDIDGARAVAVQTFPGKRRKKQSA